MAILLCLVPACLFRLNRMLGEVAVCATARQVGAGALAVVHCLLIEYWFCLKRMLGEIAVCATVTTAVVT